MPTIKQIVDALMCMDTLMRCDDCWYKSHRQPTGCAAQKKQDAAKALKKLVPKKPTIRFSDGKNNILCPTCEAVDLTAYAIWRFEYCPWCGQEIDWSSGDADK